MRGGALVQLTGAQRAVRAAFYMWVSLMNLVSVSAMWARAADVFSAEAGTRLFGVLGAGATLGQLCGSLLAAQLAGRAPWPNRALGHALGGRGGGPSLLPLLPSAGLLELAGLCALRFAPAGPLREGRQQQQQQEEGGGREGSSPVRGKEGGRRAPDDTVVLLAPLATAAGSFTTTTLKSRSSSMLSMPSMTPSKPSPARQHGAGSISAGSSSGGGGSFQHMGRRVAEGYALIR